MTPIVITIDETAILLAAVALAIAVAYVGLMAGAVYLFRLANRIGALENAAALDFVAELESDDDS